MAEAEKKPRYVSVPWTAEQKRRFEALAEELRAKKAAENSRKGGDDGQERGRP